MKKLTLLCTVLCVSALNGMKPEHGRYVGMEDLSPEIKVMVIQALNNTYDNTLSPEKNLTNTINAIRAMSLTNQELNAIVNDMYDDHKKFKKLVHLLANKFDTSTHKVATLFKTPVANEYLRLTNALMEAIADNKVDSVIQLIEQGADVNYNKDKVKMTPLLKAVIELHPKIVQALLNAGANPHFISADFGTPLDRLEWTIRLFKGHRKPEIIAIEKMLKEAMLSPKPYQIKTGESCEK